MTKAIIWDMDGVLADTGAAHYRAWRALAAELGLALTYEQFDETFGMANGPILRAWLGEAATPEQIRALADRKEALFRALVVSEVRLPPGVRAWLERARAQGFRQVVASSAPMANVVAIVAALEIGDYFDALLSGSFLPRSKPDPAIFLQAAAAVGAPPQRCVVLEDSVVGVEAARRAGMPCVAITSTHVAERLAGADRITATLDDLPEEALLCLVGE